jgi:hypothetical protein
LYSRFACNETGAINWLQKINLNYVWKKEPGWFNLSCMRTTSIGWKKEGMMIKNLLYIGAAFFLFIVWAGKAQSLDFSSLADQSSYRCSGGVVATGDSHRSVQEKCGEPVEIARLQDHGPIWIYANEQATFMYYLAFLNGKLQRIVGAPCSPDDPACFDLE